MSRYIPNTAVIREPESTPSGKRRPRRQAGHALGVQAQAVKDLDAPGAVAEHEIEHDRGHDHRPDRAADDLAQLAAAGGWGAGSALRESAHLVTATCDIK